MNLSLLPVSYSNAFAPPMRMSQSSRNRPFIKPGLNEFQTMRPIAASVNTSLYQSRGRGLSVRSSK